MNLFDRIIYQKSKGDPTNYEKVFADLRLMVHSVSSKFTFDSNKISWTYFRPVDFYNDIILDSDHTVYFYLRNDNLTFEAVFCGYSFEYDKPLHDREVIINLIYVFGQLFPGLKDFEKRPVIIHSNSPISHCPIKKLNYHFRTMLEKYNRGTKPIFEETDYYKDEKRWRKIVERKKGK